MSGFTKLVPEIISSSIWNEPSDIRIVWITLLAAKDQNGYVRGDARTIARLANVDICISEQALDKFQQPDPSSHTPDNDGRRIAPAPGGWLILNHEIYRAKDRNAYFREYMKKRREKSVVKNVNVNTTIPSVSVSVSDSEDGGSKGEDVKTSYGELNCVKLTEKEYKILFDQRGSELLLRGIDILDSYIASKGKDPYKSHYAVLKRGGWVWDRVNANNGKDFPQSRTSSRKQMPLFNPQVAK